MTMLSASTLDPRGNAWRRIYARGQETLDADQLLASVLTAQDVVEDCGAPQRPRRLHVDLVSPLNLRTSGSRGTSMTVLRPPDFRLLFVSGLRNIAGVYNVHCDGMFPSPVFTDLGDRAKGIRLVHTSAQEYRGGKTRALTGSLDYEGDLSPFVPWLALAEQTHFGSGRTNGLGEVRLAFCE